MSLASAQMLLRDGQKIKTGISLSVESKHKMESTVKTKQPSSPVAMFIFIWCVVSIKECSYSGFVDPIKEPSTGPCLKPLSHSEEEGVGKIDQK